MATAAVLTGADAWSRAMDLCVAAFADEPFVVELFGDDHEMRVEGARSLFGTQAPWPHAVVLGIEEDDRLLACAILTQPGACHACSRARMPAPSAGGADHSEWRFEQNVVDAHSGLGRHGWVSKVAVDPRERGSGLGRAVIEYARTVCDGPLVLECQPHRGPFYAACGFVEIGTIEDPAGPDALLMRAPA